ncbi:LLM class flavin-dependent oxidoreductase [Nocardia flavorosea]|nr:LLM class flavin-dependent oxidoreductase [Nocardia flavorosea]
MRNGPSFCKPATGGNTCRHSRGERPGYVPTAAHFWLFDHLWSPGLPEYPALEAWTTATALLAGTTTLRVGALVLCNNFRRPAVLGRMATSSDVISGGRLEFGLGSGSIPGEHRQAELPWGSAGERAECTRIGRDPATIRHSRQAVLAIAENERELPGVRARAHRHYGAEAFALDEGYVGTPAMLVDRLTERAGQGMDSVIFMTGAKPAAARMELFAAEVIPHLPN